MIKKLILPLVGVALFIVAVGIFIQKSSLINQPKTAVATNPTVSIGDKVIKLEVVKTTEEREKGLSGRTSLDSDSGMLFVFSDKEYSPAFWMKGMLIPLDIIWIKDGKIIKIHKNVPVPSANTPDNKLKTYTSESAVNYVLEVNSGYSDANKFKVGDTVTFSGI